MLYELRTYYAVPGKLPAMLSRFENHTTALFAKHGIRDIGYWTTVIGEDNNALVYFLTWESLAEREQRFAAFGKDPERRKVVAESEKDGPIVARIASQILAPTGFSKLR